MDDPWLAFVLGFLFARVLDWFFKKGDHDR